MKKLGIGIIGTGLGALVLRLNNESERTVEVRGMADTDPLRKFQRYDVGKNLQNLADEFHVSFVTEDYQELLKRKDINIIGIFSPCPLHFKHIREALTAGKHIVCTKPMVVSLEEAKEVAKLVDRTGLKFLVGQSMRWNDIFITAKEMHEKGEIGRIIFAESYYVHDMRGVLDRSPWRYKITQDFMYGGCCHPIDLLRWFLGDIEEVFAYGICSHFDKRYPPDKEDTFLLNLKFKSGVIGRVMGAFGLVHPPHRHMVGLGLYGTRASLYNDEIVYDKEGKHPFNKDIEKINIKGEGHAEEIPRMFKHLEECIRNDQKPLVDVRDGAKVISTCSAAWESIKTGKPVKVFNEF